MIALWLLVLRGVSIELCNYINVGVRCACLTAPLASPSGALALSYIILFTAAPKARPTRVHIELQMDGPRSALAFLFG